MESSISNQISAVNQVDRKFVERVASEVCDPEIPILTIADLGILRDVKLVEGNWQVVITPTYVGCPAMDTIADDIRYALAAKDIKNVVVKTQLAPAWTTEWLSEAGRKKLLSVGIAPPEIEQKNKRALLGETGIIRCPQCGSDRTEQVSEFGSTACKAQFKCRACLEPFDYFKCL